MLTKSRHSDTICNDIWTCNEKQIIQARSYLYAKYSAAYTLSKKETV